MGYTEDGGRLVLGPVATRVVLLPLATPVTLLAEQEASILTKGGNHMQKNFSQIQQPP
jgi:hypothetical protein